ncbi:MAG: phospholipase A [Bacteroidia bacterium]|nr:phospholipase A [Bacteroidia bacterium]MBT8229767.1 phospholipase A [Bacteroidia bacterium]NNK90406.1 hypothetical protein [Saprospiraceae bacterium]
MIQTALAQTDRSFLEVPGFTMFGDNYLITGTTVTGRNDLRASSDVKFRIGFAHRLLDRPLILGFYPYVTYQQRSFWEIYKESSPFRESNYNPGFALGKIAVVEGKEVGIFFIELEHESNGLGNEDSRSWNKISFSSKWKLTPKLQMDFDFWIPFFVDKEFNPDILDYYGFQRTGVSYIINEKFFVSFDTHLATTDGFRGNFTIGGYYNYNPDNDRYIYLQLFHGYAEDLATYKDIRTMLRIGIAFHHNYLKQLDGQLLDY